MSDSIYNKAMQGVPRVRLVDENGKELCVGYYFAYPKWNGYPIVEDVEKQDDIPLVEGIMTYDSGDWGLANKPRFIFVKPPHILKLVTEDDK